MTENAHFVSLWHYSAGKIQFFGDSTVTSSSHCNCTALLPCLNVVGHKDEIVKLISSSNDVENSLWLIAAALFWWLLANACNYRFVEFSLLWEGNCSPAGPEASKGGGTETTPYKPRHISGSVRSFFLESLSHWTIDKWHFKWNKNQQAMLWQGGPRLCS